MGAGHGAGYSWRGWEQRLRLAGVCNGKSVHGGAKKSREMSKMIRGVTDRSLARCFSHPLP